MAYQPVQNQERAPNYLPSVRSMGLLGDRIDDTLPPMLNAQRGGTTVIGQTDQKVVVVADIPRKNQGPPPGPRYHHRILHPSCLFSMPTMMDLGIHPSALREERLSYPEGILTRPIYQVQNPAYVAKDSHTQVAVDRLDKSLDPFVHPGRYRPAKEMLIPCETTAKKLALSGPGLPAPEVMRFESCFACEACKYNASLYNNQDPMEGVLMANTLLDGKRVGDSSMGGIRTVNALPVATNVGAQPMEGVRTANVLRAAQDVGVKLEAPQDIQVHALHDQLVLRPRAKSLGARLEPQAPPGYNEIGRLMFERLHRNHPGEIFDPMIGRMRKRMLMDDFPQRAGHLKEKWNSMTVDEKRQHPLYCEGDEHLGWEVFSRRALRKFLRLKFPGRKRSRSLPRPHTQPI